MVATINTHGLTPMQVGRLNKALDTLVRIDGVVMSWRDYALTTVRKRETDGMADYSRTRFNRMNGREQAAYMARLEAKRVYILEDAEGFGRAVSKVIFDAVTYEDAGEVEAAAAWTEEDSAALFGPTSIAGSLSTVSDYEADGADARAHGYGADRNPFTWGAGRGPELDANRVKREAWARGHGMPDTAPHNAFAAVMAKATAEGRAIDWDVIAPARPGFGSEA